MSELPESEQLELLHNQNTAILSYLKAINEQLNTSNSRYHHVKIENINMPFSAMVGFMVKITLASIPAALVVAVLWLLVVLVFGGMLASCSRGLF